MEERCPLLPVGARPGDVREGPQWPSWNGMCAWKPGVQGSSAVTLHQNSRLPFECLEGGVGGARQINTNVVSGVLQRNALTPVPSALICA